MTVRTNRRCKPFTPSCGQVMAHGWLRAKAACVSSIGLCNIVSSFCNVFLASMEPFYRKTIGEEHVLIFQNPAFYSAVATVFVFSNANHSALGFFHLCSRRRPVLPQGETTPTRPRFLYFLETLICSPASYCRSFTP